jgi:hypothetical protein
MDSIDSIITQDDITKFAELLFDVETPGKLRVINFSEFLTKLQEPSSLSEEERDNYYLRALYGVYCNIIDIFHDFPKNSGTYHSEYMVNSKKLTKAYLGIGDIIDYDILHNDPVQYFKNYHSLRFKNLLTPVTEVTKETQEQIYSRPLNLRKSFINPDTYTLITGRNYFVTLPYIKEKSVIGAIDNEFVNFTRNIIDNARTKQLNIRQGINDATGVESSFLFGKIEEINGNGYTIPNTSSPPPPTQIISFPTIIDSATLHHKEEDVTKTKHIGETTEIFKVDNPFTEIELPLYEHKLSVEEIEYIFSFSSIYKLHYNIVQKTLLLISHSIKCKCQPVNRRAINVIKVATKVSPLPQPFSPANINKIIHINIPQFNDFNTKITELFNETKPDGVSIPNDEDIKSITRFILYSLKSLGDKSFSLYRLWRASTNDYLYGFTQDRNASIVDQILMNPLNGLTNTTQIYKRGIKIDIDNEIDKLIDYTENENACVPIINFKINLDLDEGTKKMLIKKRQKENLLMRVKKKISEYEFINYNYEYLDNKILFIKNLLSLIIKKFEFLDKTKIGDKLWPNNPNPRVFDLKFTHFILSIYVLYLQLIVKNKLIEVLQEKYKECFNIYDQRQEKPGVKSIMDELQTITDITDDTEIENDLTNLEIKFPGFNCCIEIINYLYRDFVYNNDNDTGQSLSHLPNYSIDNIKNEIDTINDKPPDARGLTLGIKWFEKINDIISRNLSNEFCDILNLNLVFTNPLLKQNIVSIEDPNIQKYFDECNINFIDYLKNLIEISENTENVCGSHLIITNVKEELNNLKDKVKIITTYNDLNSEIQNSITKIESLQVGGTQQRGGSDDYIKRIFNNYEKNRHCFYCETEGEDTSISPSESSSETPPESSSETPPESSSETPPESSSEDHLVLPFQVHETSTQTRPFLPLFSAVDDEIEEMIPDLNVGYSQTTFDKTQEYSNQSLPSQDLKLSTSPAPPVPPVSSSLLRPSPSPPQDPFTPSTFSYPIAYQGITNNFYFKHISEYENYNFKAIILYLIQINNLLSTNTDTKCPNINSDAPLRDNLYELIDNYVCVTDLTRLGKRKTPPQTPETKLRGKPGSPKGGAKTRKRKHKKNKKPKKTKKGKKILFKKKTKRKLPKKKKTKRKNKKL